MHPLPVGSYVPQAKFASPRSFYYWIAWNIYPVVITNIGSTYFLTDTATGLITTTVALNPLFWQWSSNSYSLDWIIDDYYYQLTPGGAKVYPNFTLYYSPKIQNHGEGLEFRYFTMDFGRTQLSYLPAQPSGYWLPPPL